MTWRKLDWMAREKMKRAGELTAFHLAMIAGMFGAKIDPAEINPYREAEAETPAMRRLREWQQKRRWKVMASANKAHGGLTSAG